MIDPGVAEVAAVEPDRRRLVPGSEEEMMANLRWLGIQWDEGPDVGGPHGPYRQSERSAIYCEHAERLVAEGAAYPCFCTRERLEDPAGRRDMLKVIEESPAFAEVRARIRSDGIVKTSPY